MYSRPSRPDRRPLTSSVGPRHPSDRRSVSARPTRPTRPVEKKPWQHPCLTRPYLRLFALWLCYSGSMDSKSTFVTCNHDLSFSLPGINRMASHPPPPFRLSLYTYCIDRSWIFMGTLWGILGCLWLPKGTLWASTDYFPPYSPQIVFILDNPCVRKIGGRSNRIWGEGIRDHTLTLPTPIHATLHT